MGSITNADPVDLQKASDYQLLFERGGKVDDETFLRVLKEAIGIADETGFPYLVMGGIASSAMGRPRWTHDIDLFIRPEDAESMLEAFAQEGFVTQQTYPDWLFKAIKDEVLIDFIFRSAGDIYLDDEMFQRATQHEINGVTLRLVSIEDLIVIKAIAHVEQSARHWHDALSLLAKGDIDWEYLISRAVHGPRRVASLLIYAQSCDYKVPDEPIRELLRTLYEVKT